MTFLRMVLRLLLLSLKGWSLSCPLLEGRRDAHPLNPFWRQGPPKPRRALTALLSRRPSQPTGLLRERRRSTPQEGVPFSSFRPRERSDRVEKSQPLAVPLRESGERSEPKGFLRPPQSLTPFVTAPLQGRRDAHPLNPPPQEGVPLPPPEEGGRGVGNKTTSC